MLWIRLLVDDSNHSSSSSSNRSSASVAQASCYNATILRMCTTHACALQLLYGAFSWHLHFPTAFASAADAAALLASTPRYAAARLCTNPAAVTNML
jgi:hypothetical protein